MSDYTPSTGEVRRRYAYARSGKPCHRNQSAVAEFDRWLAAHDARKRAEWEAEQGEVEWEYGLTWEPYVTGDGSSPVSYTGCETEEGAWETGHRLAGSAQKPRVWKRPMRPAIQAVPAGPWVPVNENGSTS